MSRDLDSLSRYLQGQNQEPTPKRSRFNLEIIGALLYFALVFVAIIAPPAAAWWHGLLLGAGLMFAFMLMAYGGEA